MGFCNFNYRSQTLSRWMDITIVIPTSNLSYSETSKGHNHKPGNTGDKLELYQPGMKYQTIYFLHGGGDDNSLPYRFTCVERYADENNVMLVTPDIANSFGVDTNYGIDYSAFLTDELPIIIQSLFPSSPKREDNFIVGYGMGGNAALGAALMHPELYCVCADISGGIGLTVDIDVFKEELDGDHFKYDFPLVASTFGSADNLENSRHNIKTAALQNIADGKELPKFYLTAGSEEFFIGKRVKSDADILAEMGYDVTYACEGGYRHDFKFWDSYFERLITEILPLKRKPLTEIELL